MKKLTHQEQESRTAAALVDVTRIEPRTSFERLLGALRSGPFIGSLATMIALTSLSATASPNQPAYSPSRPLPWSTQWLNTALDSSDSSSLAAMRLAAARSPNARAEGTSLQLDVFGPWLFDPTSPAQVLGSAETPFAGFADPIFALTTPAPITSNTFTAVTSDVNGDGYPDLVTAQYDGTINVLLNPGPGNLGAIALSSTNTSATDPANKVAFLTAADLNGDGHPDLVALERNSNRVIIFLNDSHGSFGNGVAYPFVFPDGATFRAGGGNVLVGDVTGDGIPDLVALAFNPVTDPNNGQTVTTIHYRVATGNGDGSFGTVGPDQTTVFTGLLSNFSAQAALVDVNHDQKLDLVVEAGGGDSTGAYTLVFAALGSGSGTFTGLPSVYPSTGAIVTNATTSAANANPPVSFEIVDSNGDGNPDVLFTVIDSVRRYVNVYRTLGNADGTFNTPTLTLGGATLDSQANFAFADLDGDGIFDAIAYNIGNIAVHKGNADGTFTQEPEFRRVSAIPTYPPLKPADFDGDGKPDLVAIDDVTSAAGIFVSNNNYSGNDALWNSGENAFVYPFAVGHVSGPGAGDILLSSYNQHSDDFNVFFYIEAAVNDGHGHYVYHSALTANQLSAHNVLQALPVSADLNGDGQLDILVTTWTGVSIALSNGDGSYQDLVDLPMGQPTECDPTAVDVGDVNGDGFPDIVVAYPGDQLCYIPNGVPSGLVVMLNDGQGNFTSTFTAYGQAAWAPKLVDFNGDGKLDVALSETNFYFSSTPFHQLDVIPGNGDGTFDTANATVPILNKQVVAIVPGDYDNDGIQDLTVGIFNQDVVGHFIPGTSGIYRLKGNGDFTFATISPVPDAAVGTISGDGHYVELNGDGYSDLALRVGGPVSAFGYLLGQSDGTLGPLQQSFAIASGGQLVGGGRAIFIADEDGNGSPDVVTDSGYGTNIFRNLSDTIFTNGFGGD